MILRTLFPTGLAERLKDRRRGFVGVNLPFGMPLDAKREPRGVRDDKPLYQTVVGSGLDRESVGEPVYGLRMQRIDRGVGLAGDPSEQAPRCE